jgi:hypothetical protein
LVVEPAGTADAVGAAVVGAVSVCAPVDVDVAGCDCADADVEDVVEFVLDVCSTRTHVPFTHAPPPSLMNGSGPPHGVTSDVRGAAVVVD